MPATPEQIRAVWTDPEFHALGVEDRRSAMSTLDPEFALLPMEEQNSAFEQAYKAYYVKRLPPPPQDSDAAMAASGLPPAMPAQPQQPSMREQGIMDALSPRAPMAHPAARMGKQPPPGAELDRLLQGAQPIPGVPKRPAFTQSPGPQGSFLNEQLPIPGTERLGPLPGPAQMQPDLRPVSGGVQRVVDETGSRVADYATEMARMGMSPLGNVGGTMPLPMGDSREAYQRQAEQTHQAMETPLVPISEVVPDGMGVIAAGGKGVLRGVEGFTSPEQVAMLGTLAGAGAASATARATGAVPAMLAADVLDTALGTYFTVESAKGLTETGKRAYEAWEQKDYPKVAEELGVGSVEALMATLVGKHTLGHAKQLGEYGVAKVTPRRDHRYQVKETPAEYPPIPPLADLPAPEGPKPAREQTINVRPVEEPVTPSDPVRPTTTPTGYPTLVPDGRGGFVESPAVPAIAGPVRGAQGLSGASSPKAPVEPAPAPVQTPTGVRTVEVAPPSVDSPAPKAETPKHDYSSTQVNLPEHLSVAVRQLGSKISPEDLGEDGAEKTPHVTVKYGLHTDDVQEVTRAIGAEPPVTVRIGKPSLFENEDADVLKFDVDSPDLHRLNKKISDAIEHTDTHPEYKPHITIGYLKPGTGKKYLEVGQDLVGKEFTLDHISFSDRNRNQVDVPLTGELKPTELKPPAESQPPQSEGARPESEVIQPLTPVEVSPESPRPKGRNPRIPKDAKPTREERKTAEEAEASLTRKKFAAREMEFYRSGDISDLDEAAYEGFLDRVKGINYFKPGVEPFTNFYVLQHARVPSGGPAFTDVQAKKAIARLVREGILEPRLEHDDEYLQLYIKQLPATAVETPSTASVNEAPQKQWWDTDTPPSFFSSRVDAGETLPPWNDVREGYRALRQRDPDSKQTIIDFAYDLKSGTGNGPPSTPVETPSTRVEKKKKSKTDWRNEFDQAYSLIQEGAINDSDRQGAFMDLMRAGTELGVRGLPMGANGREAATALAHRWAEKVNAIESSAESPIKVGQEVTLSEPYLGHQTGKVERISESGLMATIALDNNGGSALIPVSELTSKPKGKNPRIPTAKDSGERFIHIATKVDGDTIKVTISDRKPDSELPQVFGGSGKHELTLTRAEWEETKKHANPNYPQKQLVDDRLGVNDLNIEPDASSRLNRISDRVIQTVKKALQAEPMANETRTIEGGDDNAESRGQTEAQPDGAEHPTPLGGALSEGSESTSSGGANRGRGRKSRRSSGDSDGTVYSQRSGVPSGARAGDGTVSIPAGPRVEERNDHVSSTRFESDYRIPDGRRISGTPEKRAADNIRAIETLRALEQTDRRATPEEQAILADYVGWGAVPQLFAGNTPEWRAEQERLKSLISPDEFEEARRSTTNAHYTSDLVVDGIWSAMKCLGAKPGMSWLEPAVGVGNFFGRQPVELLPGARRLGIDKDGLSAQIAKYLYPDSAIEHTSFEKAELPKDYFDAAVSNVPFGDFGVHDPEFSGAKKFLSASIHNYFFAKSIGSVRPGGVVAFVTSRYTMDGYDKGHKAVRDWLNQRADFLGAVRLPASAFKQNAGTDVITDVIFLRRRLPGAESASKPWVETETRQINRAKREGQSMWLRPSAHITTNEWYAAHPEAILGQESIDRGQFTDSDYVVTGEVTPEAFSSALEKILTKDAFQEWNAATGTKRPVRLREVSAEATAKLGGLFFGDKGELYRRTSRGSAEPVEAGEADKVRIRGQLGIRDALSKLLEAELGDKPEKELKQLREILNHKYDIYVKQQGVLSGRANLKALDGDPDAPLLISLEQNYDPKAKTADKAQIFSKRMLQARQTVTSADGPESALAITLNEKGLADWDHMSALTGQSVVELQKSLTGIVYEDPVTKTWQTADEYLSGSVRKKLKAARAIAKIDSKYEENVKALEKVQPEDIPPSQIRARLGVTWVPTELYSDFVKHILQSGGTPKVNYLGGEWHIEAWGGQNTGKWNTKRVSALELLQSSFNMRAIKVYDRDSNGNASLNQEETIAAQAKQSEIQQEFEEWLFGDDTRGPEMARRYNDLMNDLVQRKFDGSHLTLPGMSRAALRDGDLEPYQKAAVWRGISQRNVLLDHAPGAGKTYEMIAIGMELKRLGLVKRPMYVVPNTTLDGWQKQFAALYPGKRVLVFSEKDLEKANRQRIMAQIATGEWDAVVVPHSSFQFLRVGDEVFKRHFDELADLLDQQISEAEGAGMDSRFVKRLEKAKERLLEQLEERRNAEKQDQTVTWEQLGIDQLFVDESHEYKKLGFATKQAGTAGIDQQGNQKTFDLLMKLRYTQEHGRGAVFGTGTPVTNTMGELYSILRYLIEPDIKARGIGSFDDWSANFGRTVPVFERKPEGGGYRLKQRFSKFVNLPELASLYRSFADVITSDMLNIPRPKLKGGERQAVITEMTDAQLEFLKTLQERGADIRRSPRDAMPDNMLAVFTDATKMTLDIRLVDREAGDDPDSRLNQAAQNIYEIWKETKGNNSTQLVFSDMGLPADRARSRSIKGTGFSVYDELIDKLVKRGIPRAEIAHAYEAKNKIERAQLFRKVNQGQIRVLLGSTAKIGQGVNVQERVAAMHHLDTPHRPSDLEQREARGIRQGNVNPEVAIFTYLTRGSLDELKMGGVLRKAKFINDYRKGDTSVREAEDVDEHSMVPSLEQFTALASGDPRIMRKMEIDNEVDRLSRLQAAWRDQRFSMRREAAGIPDQVKRIRTVAAKYQSMADTRDKTGRVWVVDKNRYEGDGIRDKVADAVHEIADAAKALQSGEEISVGTAFGLPLTARHGSFGGVYIYINGINPDNLHLADTPLGTFARIENAIKALDTRAKSLEGEVPPLLKKQAGIEEELGKPWRYAEQFDKLVTEQKELIKALGGEQGDNAAAVGDADITDARVEADEVEDDTEDEPESGIERRRRTQSGAAKLEFLQPWKWARKDAKPESPKVNFLDDAVEQRFQSAGQPNEPKLKEKLDEALEKFRGLGRVYQHLPADKYSRLIFELNKFQKQGSIASTNALHNVVNVTNDFDANQYDLFRKKVVIDDLRETLEDWQRKGEVPDGESFEMAFGLTPEKLKAEHDHISAAAAADPKIRAAIDTRNRKWNGIREDFIEAMEAAGVEMDTRFQKKSYFRHRVLEHLQTKVAGSSKLATPVGRSYQKRRGVNALDYSTSYIESEYEVMTQILHDTKKAELIAWLKNSEYNILDKLKGQARSHNVAAVMPYFEELAKEINNQQQNPNAPEVTGAELFRQQLNSMQAQAIEEIAKKARSLPDDNGRWRPFLDELSDAWVEKKAIEADTDEPQHVSVDMKRLLKYASWLIKQGQEGSQPAAMLFKGIRNKQKEMKRIAGDKFIDTADPEQLAELLAPEGHVLWYPREGNIFYKVHTLPEQIAEKIMENADEAFGVSAADLKRAIAKGGRYTPFVLPEEVAKTLDEMAPKQSKDVAETIANISAGALNKWKEWQLINPARVIKYNLRNLSGDGEITFVGNPKAFRRAGKAAADLWNYYRKHEFSPELRAWFERGGFQSNLQAQEMGDLRNIDALERLMKSHQQRPSHPAARMGGALADVPGKYLRGARLATDFREGLLRYANFLEYLDQARRRKFDNYGASIPSEVGSLDDPADQAYKLSNDLLGAYDEVSTAGRHVRRHWIPFWSFQELNWRRYWRLMRNAARDEKLASAIGRKMFGAAVARSPYLAFRLGSAALMMGAMWFLLNTYNQLIWPDEEKALREEIRSRPHIIFGRTPDGQVRYFSRLGNLPDLLEWVDPEGMRDTWRDWLDGRVTAMQAIADMLWQGPIEKAWLGINPAAKIPAELVSGKTAYPSIDRPRTIHDRAEYLADHFSLGDIYRWAMGKPQPQKSVGRRVGDLASYEADPKQSAYYDTLDVKSKWLQEHGKAGSSGAGNPKSEAVRNVKLALRYGDKEAFAKYLAEYAALGGTREGFKQSVQSLHPLYGLNQQERREFFSNLKDEDRDRLKLALEYYQEVFVGPRLSEYARDAAPTIQKRMAAAHPAARLKK